MGGVSAQSPMDDVLQSGRVFAWLLLMNRFQALEHRPEEVTPGRRAMHKEDAQAPICALPQPTTNADLTRVKIDQGSLLRR